MPSASSAIGRLRLPRHVPRWHWVLVGIVITLYIAAALSGATTSSIGIDHLTVDPNAARTDHWGALQPIRSDEYNVGTPITLSMIADGGVPTLSPLGAEASLLHRYPVGPVQRLVFFDALPFLLGGIVPTASLFAAHWWLPTLLVLLCMPTWFVLMGGRRHLGWLAGPLVVLAPSNFWWSLQPTEQIAYTLAGCTAMLAAARRLGRGERAVPILQCLVGGVCIAGMPTNYLLWSLLLGGGVLLASTVRLLSRRDRRALLALVATGVLAAGLGGAILWEGRTGLTAVASTVYPGKRTSTAAAVDPGMLLGAPQLWALPGSEPQGTNASELSTALNLAILLIPVVWLARPGRLAVRDRLGEFALAGWAFLWLGWAMTTIGDLGRGIPIMSSVPPERSAQAIGVIGVIALCLALSHVRSGGTGQVLLTGAVAATATLWAGALLEAGALPEMNAAALWASGLLTGAWAALLVARPRSWIGPVVAVTASLATVITASPLQFGVADMRDSAAADRLASAAPDARARGELWASDSLPVNALMLANGVPTYTGLQRSGPDAEAWRALDPGGRFESSWNRGGGYVNLNWVEGAPTTISDDGYDSIYIQADPCTLAQTEPRISTVISTVPLASSTCLVQRGTLTFSGTTHRIYEVQR